MKSKSARLLDTDQIEVSDAMEDLFADQDIAQDAVLNKKDMLDIVRGTSELTEQEQQAMNFAALREVGKLVAMNEDLQRIQRFMNMDNKRPKSILGAQVQLAELKSVRDSKKQGNILPVKESSRADR